MRLDTVILLEYARLFFDPVDAPLSQVMLCLKQKGIAHKAHIVLFGRRSHRRCPWHKQGVAVSNWRVDPVGLIAGKNCADYSVKRQIQKQPAHTHISLVSMSIL